MESMTGFGMGVSIRENFQVSCHIKSLNHRYLEINIKVPKRYALLEERIRKLLAETFLRGKLELTIKITGLVKERREIIFDLEMARALYENLIKTKEELGISSEVTLRELLEFREWILFEEKEEELDKLWEEIREAIELAIKDLRRARREEGEKLKERITDYLTLLKERIELIETRKEEVRSENVEKMKRRIYALLEEFGTTLDLSRLYQEIAILLDRSDFTEELERLKVHLSHMETLLKEEGSGKKLDFLCQELHREITTLSNKAQSPQISAIAVEIKDLIEKIREQVQNVV